MRPQAAKRLISKLLWDRYIENGDLKSKSLLDIQNDLKSIKNALLSMHKKSMQEERRYNIEHGSTIDDRSGEETYGYDSLDSIKDNLVYVSDRYNCAFRLRWLIDLMDIDKDNVL